MFGEKVLQQPWNIFLSLTEGPQAQNHAVYSEIQFPAKTSCLYFLFQVALCRRYESPDRLSAAAFWLPVRQQGKQYSLTCGVQFVHTIQEHSSRPSFSVRGVGKRLLPYFRKQASRVQVSTEHLFHGNCSKDSDLMEH